MIRARIHRHGDERLLAACDGELLGKTFQNGMARVTITEAFYGGDEITEETLAERMGSVTMMNLFGERAIILSLRRLSITPFTSPFTSLKRRD